MESSRLGLSFVPFRPQGEESGYFLLLASPQELTSAQDIVHKDVVFVFDTSGSMGQARKIDQAREALKRCLSNLNAEDRFAVVAFNDSLNPFASHFLDASSANLQQALLFAERNQGRTRIFAFGVGADVNRTFLEQLGSENRGGYGFVADGQDIDTLVGGFYAKIAKPVLSESATRRRGGDPSVIWSCHWGLTRAPLFSSARTRRSAPAGEYAPAIRFAVMNEKSITRIAPAAIGASAEVHRRRRCTPASARATITSATSAMTLPAILDGDVEGSRPSGAATARQRAAQPAP